MLKNKMTSELSGIILQHVREPKGRLTEISDLSRINRCEFNSQGLAKMKFHRLARIIYAMCLVLGGVEYRNMMDELQESLKDYAEKFDYDLLDE